MRALTDAFPLLAAAGRSHPEPGGLPSLSPLTWEDRPCAGPVPLLQQSVTSRFYEIVLGPGQIHVPSDWRPGISHAGRNGRAGCCRQSGGREADGAGWTKPRPAHRQVSRLVCVRGVTMDLARRATCQIPNADYLLGLGSLVLSVMNTDQPIRSGPPPCTSRQLRPRTTRSAPACGVLQGGGAMLLPGSAVRWVLPRLEVPAI